MLQRSAARSLVWIYLHIPLIMSIVAMGAALEDTLRMVKASAVLNTAFLQLSWGLGMLLVAAIAALGLEQPTLASKKLAIILGALAGLLSVALVLLDVRLSPIATLIILACRAGVVSAGSLECESRRNNDDSGRRSNCHVAARSP